ncbi:MAG: hypothetical protein WKG01_14210 [Kofleriaceae bacterium]
MTSKRAVAIAWLAACSPPGGGTTPQPPEAPAWTVEVTVPAELSYTFLSTTEASATQAERPIVFLDGGVHFATSAERVVLTRGPLADGHVVGVLETPDRTELETIRGTQLVVPYSVVPRGAWWFDASGLLAAWFVGTQLTVAQLASDGGSLAWSATTDTPPGQIELLGTWASELVLAIRQPAGTRLHALDLATHRLRPLIKLPAGPIALAPRVGQVAVVYSLAPDACTSCGDRVAIYRLDERRRIRELALQPASERLTIGERATWGFDGTVLWTYLYESAGRNDAGPYPHRESCGYEVYEVSTGNRVRTLETATGTWGALLANCRVRALLPRPDGGVLAIHATDERRATAVKFAHPP